MLDVVYLVAILALFALVALVARGVEKLGPQPGSASARTPVCQQCAVSAQRPRPSPRRPDQASAHPPPRSLEP